MENQTTETVETKEVMPKVAVLVMLPQTIDLIISYAPSDFEVVGGSAYLSDSEKIEIMKDADFLMLHGRGRVSEKCLRSAGKLKLYQLLGVGYDGEKLPLLSELGIALANMPGAILNGVSEMAVTFMLALNRRLIQLDAGTRAGKWRPDLTTGIDHYELTDKTVGIIGFGQIGKAVARRLRGFDNTILYYDPVSYPDAEKELKATRVSLDRLMRESDIVTIHAPLMPETRGLIGERELLLMKPSAIFINLGRGPIVDERALISVLQAGKIRGAGLDVFEQEPVEADNPLLKMENVVLTPHQGGTTREVWRRRADFSFENFRLILEGKPPLSLVQPGSRISN